jgi:hypothetical protein
LSARLEWYGVYTASKTKEIADPTSPTGVRYESTPLAPPSSNDRIPGKEGIHFGFSYVLSGQRGATVTVKRIVRFPPGGMLDKIAGGSRSTQESVGENTIGDPHLFGYSFKDAEPEQILFGEWSMEVWQGGHKLAEKRFTVFQP